MSKMKVVIWVIVCLMVAALGCFFVPRILLHMAVKELPQCVQGEFVTDFTSREQNTFTVSNDYYSVEIPDGYIKREGTESLNVSSYESMESDRTYLLFDYGADMTMSLLDEQWYEEEEKLKNVNIKRLEKAFNKLEYGIPDSFYNVQKAIVLLKEEDYSFWDIDRQLVFFVLGTFKSAWEGEQSVWLYERDDIRAIIRQQEGMRYVIDVVNAKDLNTAYGVLMKNAEEEDVWKLLNSWKFH